MSNIDNGDSVYKIDNCESVYKNERQILENEEEFIYISINPFCETVVEQKLSKEKLKRILEKGMQKSIPLAKIKQARRDLDKLPIYGAKFTDEYRIHLDREEVFSILDKLIAESEG